jgi:hypothetical protein
MRSNVLRGLFFSVADTRALRQGADRLEEHFKLRGRLLFEFLDALLVVEAGRRRSLSIGAR